MPDSEQNGRERRLLAGLSDLALALLDAAGNIETWSAGAERLFGVPAADAVGRSIAFIYTDEDVRAGQVERQLADARETPAGHAHEGWRVRADGTRFWAGTLLNPAPGGGLAMAVRDLDDRHALDERSHRREQRLRLLIDAMRDHAAFTLDPEGKVATWSAGAERILHYSEKEILGQHFAVFYPPGDDRDARCAQALALAAATGREEEEGWRLRKDGSRLWARVILGAIRDERGQLIGYTEVTRDLSERRRVEDQLRQSEQRYRQLVDSIQDYAVFMLDPQGYVATWNPGAERIYGFPTDAIAGKHFSAFYSPAEVRAGKCDMELSVATTTGRFEDEGWRMRKDGSRFWANVVINAVRNEQDSLIGFSKVTRDLTTRKRAEEETARRLAAEQANRAKDEFLAMLGHELRNPLAPIVTALQLIASRATQLGMHEIAVIERQVKHMVRLVDDLLDMARLQRGKIDLDLTPLDLHQLVEQAVEVASPLFERRRHHLALGVPEDLSVVGDEARLVQVFANLLTNAAKYTDDGGHVAVSAWREAERAIVEIRDDGKGIPADMLPRIFEPFVQGQQSSERSSGGLGIGLTLVRELLAGHGGEVTAHSDGPGKGSTFRVSLPSPARALIDAAVPHPAPTTGTLPRAARPCRILLVDDNEDARELSAMMLRRVGHEVVTAADGAEALEVVKAFVPEVAILDIGLPVLDGYQLAVRLRDALAGEPIKLVALTGYGQAHDRERSSRAGFHRHLVKPIEARELLESIDEVRR